VACYARGPGESKFRALAMDVLRIEDGLVKEITTFELKPLAAAFDLPVEL
jgi:RNA polymerase sigma-70 factor (ECF subfamily)